MQSAHPWLDYACKSADDTPPLERAPKDHLAGEFGTLHHTFLWPRLNVNTACTHTELKEQEQKLLSKYGQPHASSVVRLSPMDMMKNSWYMRIPAFL